MGGWGQCTTLLAWGAGCGSQSAACRLCGLLCRDSVLPCPVGLLTGVTGVEVTSDAAESSTFAFLRDQNQQYSSGIALEIPC